MAMNQGAASGPRNGADICAVMVTYHPDAELAARVARILPQVGALVIVDNGSGEAALERLRALTRDPAIALILNSRNLGIARALNIGIDRASALKFAWVLLLDQDSAIDGDMVDTLIKVHASFPDTAHLAVVGAGFRDVNAAPSSESAGEPGGDLWIERESVITSGSLIALSVHAAIGPFREEFFIDYVDTDYCRRAHAKGYRVIETRLALMSHAIGAATGHTLLWTEKWTSNHSPDRRYYIARNDTVMLRERGRHPFGLWALKSLGRRIRTVKRILLYERQKGSKTMAVAQGLWDGVRGRLGPRSE